VILIGTSGFSFDDWTGPFYPAGLSRGARLSFYTEHFPVVEVNSTYYGIPHPRVFHEMERKTPEGFEFLVKLHANQTHTRRDVPETTALLLEAVAPLVEARKFGGFLAQFPWAFRASPESAAHVERLRALIPRVAPFYVEFRHDSWIREETFERLRALGVGYCSVDEPRIAGLVPPIARATGAPGYVRFHGRNAKTWWGRGDGDRYDYAYSEAELREWVAKIRALERETGKVYLFFNNCHAGQAVKGAKLMAGLLAEMGA
jgi:uncharacterized protein YecE (DUF72 family)